MSGCKLKKFRYPSCKVLRVTLEFYHECVLWLASLAGFWFEDSWGSKCAILWHLCEMPVGCNWCLCACFFYDIKEASLWGQKLGARLVQIPESWSVLRYTKLVKIRSLATLALDINPSIVPDGNLYMPTAIPACLPLATCSYLSGLFLKIAWLHYYIRHQCIVPKPSIYVLQKMLTLPPFS